MSKARKEALDWLPKRKDGRKRCYQCNDDDVRSIYAKGYRKAEKNSGLTWKDVNTIIGLYNDLDEKTLCNPERACKEILKQFKDMKK